MGVFFGFGKAKLAAPMAGHPMPKGVFYRLGGEHHIDEFIMQGRVFGHAGHRRQFRPPPGFAHIEARLSQGAQYLPGAVRAKIQKQQTVTILHAGVIANHRRADEFITFTCSIGRLNRRRGGFCRYTLTIDHQLKRLLHPLPAVVAVHRVKAANHRGNTGLRRQGGFKRGDLPKRRFGRHITPIQKSMDNHLHPGGGNHLRRFGDMIEMGMHPAL